MRPSAAPGHQGQTILIVDDTPANVGMLVDYLEDHGFRIIVAQDGAEGIKRAHFARPDLILLDAMMPGMDGFETCRRLKASDDTSNIPIIFMTALTDAAEKVAGFGAGAVDYVTKPFQIEEVHARVTTHLSLRAMRRQLEAQNVLLQQEIAVRLQTEAELRLTQFFVDHAVGAIFWLTAEGGISYVNQAACRLMRHPRETLMTMHWSDIEVDVTPEAWPCWWADIKVRRSHTLETRVRIKGGIVIPLAMMVNHQEFGGQEHAFIYARDMSERRLAEHSLSAEPREIKLKAETRKE